MLFHCPVLYVLAQLKLPDLLNANSVKKGFHMSRRKKPNIVCFTVKGRNSFQQADLRRLNAVARMTFIKANKVVLPKTFMNLTKDADFLAISPRSFPKLEQKDLKHFKKLKGVILPTTGIEWLDVNAFLKNGFSVANTPGYSSVSCAEYTWGLMLTVIRNIADANSDLRKTMPSKRSLLGTELAGKCIGVVGLGSIGKIICRYALAFDMKVLGWDQENQELPGVQRTSLKNLLAQSDIVSLHLPLNKKTKHLLKRSTLKGMKKGSILINTARPGLVNMNDLEQSLRQEKPSRYAFDIGYLDTKIAKVFSKNPAIFAVPHVSWYTKEAVQREMTAWTDAIVAMAQERPINLILEVT